jgi:peptidyl-dipeptidase Dcp
MMFPFITRKSKLEVKEADGRYIGLLYMDFYPRDGKRVGAWNTGFRDQAIKTERKYGTPLPPLSVTLPAHRRSAGFA